MAKIMNQKFIWNSSTVFHEKIKLLFARVFDFFYFELLPFVSFEHKYRDDDAYFLCSNWQCIHSSNLQLSRSSLGSLDSGPIKQFGQWTSCSVHNLLGYSKFDNCPQTKLFHSRTHSRHTRECCLWCYWTDEIFVLAGRVLEIINNSVVRGF